ncbi:MAG: preprotein translocase subunit SecG [Hyphomicrobiales bacterium]
MQTVILVIHLLVALALIGVVLLQRSEGGALGIGGGGGGGAGNLFSARGVGNALTRTTAWLAIAFFATSITLTVLATRGGSGGSVFDKAPATQSEPAAPAGSTAPSAPAAPAEGTGGSVLPQLPQAPASP